MRALPRLLLSSLAALCLAGAAEARAAQTVGLFQNTDQAQEGYTLMAPLRSTQTYLLDMNGRPVNQWSSAFTPGTMAYFLPSGGIIRSASLQATYHPHWATAAGGGGRVEGYDWDGSLVWVYELSNAQYLLHHDIEVLPNGNVLMMAWDYRTAAEAIANGRNPSMLSESALWSERLIEVRPNFPVGGDIVWEWNAWNHLIQDFDPTKANYGVIADNPGRLDINPAAGDTTADFLHFNGMKYHPEFRQIIISVHRFSELWVLDHTTTTAQAATAFGGRYGQGGRILYRWGNPQMYDRGTAADQQLFRQHDAQWIPEGYPGEGNILIYNNGFTRPAGNFSTVDEIVPPVDEEGFYTLPSGQPFGPTAPVWSYQGTPPTAFYSQIISGAERQPNGNTLICAGVPGRLFEVTPAKATVWQYVNPINDLGPIAQESPPTNNLVFKVRRYPPDHPGLIGRTLVPGPPLEIFTAPPPVPDGSGGTLPVKARRMIPSGGEIEVTWDATSCPAPAYNLLYGSLSQVASGTVTGSRCAIGFGGPYLWQSVPAGDLFFLLVGRSANGLYESGWGDDSSGSERHGTASSAQCGVTQKAEMLSCP